MVLLGSSAKPGRRIGSEGPELGSVLVGIVSTALLHAGIVGMFLLQSLLGGDEPPKPEPDKKMEFEDVKLLKLGEEKPDHQLPRISNPPPPQENKEVVDLDPEEKKDPEPKEEPEKEPEPAKEKQQAPEPKKKPPQKDDSEDRKEAMNEAFDSLHDSNRPTNDDAPEGSEKGVAGGSISDEAMANLMNTFQAKLIQAISNRWRVPTTIPQNQLPDLKGTVEVYVRLSGAGHIVSYRFRKRSSNDQFNRSIERVLRQFQVSGGGAELPLPDDDRVRQFVLRKGLNLQNWEYTER